MTLPTFVHIAFGYYIGRTLYDATALFAAYLDRRVPITLGDSAPKEPQ